MGAGVTIATPPAGNRSSMAVVLVDLELVLDDAVVWLFLSAGPDVELDFLDEDGSFEEVFESLAWVLVG